MKKTIDIAIIGKGAAGVSFLHHLVEHLQSNPLQRVTITIFDAEGRATNKVYQNDVDTALLNTPAHLMSPINENANDFSNWILNKTNNHIQTDEDLYLPRRVFGEYLHEFYIKTKLAAIAKGIRIVDINKKVIKITQSLRYQIFTNGNFYNFDYVILCVGNERQADHYNLLGYTNYINNPFPLKSKLKIPAGKKVAIIGSGLSAIDVAIALANSSASPKEIHMISRSGRLPPVRSKKTQLYRAHYLSLDNISNHNQSLSLQSIQKLLRKELRHANVSNDWRQIILKENLISLDIDSLKQEIFSAEKAQIKWQQVFRSTNAVIEQLWKSLPDQEKQIFMHKYHRYWSLQRTSFPAINAHKLHNMMASNKLAIKGCLSQLELKNNEFHVKFSNSSDIIRYDWVINATGPSRQVLSDNKLITSLITDGYARNDRYGGIQVDFETNSIIDKFGMFSHNFKAIGHLTSGTYYYTSSLEMISKRSKKTAMQIACDIKSFYMCDQNALCKTLQPKNKSILGDFAYEC